MNDPWKFIAFPASALGGYLISQTEVSTYIQSAVGVSELAAEASVVAVTGLMIGFIVDQLLPAYLEKKRGSRIGSDVGDEPEIDFE